MLAITYRAVDELAPYARNARTHTQLQVEQIANSITEFGWTNPVLIDETGGVIAGHGRLLAARKLKMAQVPTITLTGLSDAQRRALVLADNQLAISGAAWDTDLLRTELQTLSDEGFKLDVIGFSLDELGALLALATLNPLRQWQHLRWSSPGPWCAVEIARRCSGLFMRPFKAAFIFARCSAVFTTCLRQCFASLRTTRFVHPGWAH